MRASAQASAADLRALADIVSQDRPDVPAKGGLPPSLLADLTRQIRCDTLTFLGLDSGRQTCWFAQGIPPIDTSGDGDLDRTMWEHYWDCKPCSYPDRSGDLRSIVTVADFYSARQWHATGMYHDFYRPLGIEHEIQLCLPEASGQTSGSGRTVRLTLYRGPGSDFSERDRALLVLLRPHLHQAYLDAERRRRDTPELTQRQWELLRLVAAGHTNGQIARRLGVSEGTVRIHLQNIYGRLQVSSRTAAVTRAFPDLAAVQWLSRPASPGHMVATLSMDHLPDDPGEC
jgi:DNA-binding CsgD family transcriptional regulator